jgi:hypothetical protein
LTNDNSTQYTFSSTEGGTISIGGSCSSDNNTAVADNMTVSFTALADGTYSNCTIIVTDSAGNSVTIDVNSFTIDTTAPTLVEVAAVTTPTSDNTSSYTFSSTEAGSITYGGRCGSSTTSATADNNTITFNALADETYSNCTISVTDNASNTSDNLSVSSFKIDTLKPVLAQVTAVTTPTNDTTPGYAFSSNEAGTISYSGCSPGETSAISGTNSISFGTLSEASYSCTITVTDSAANTSSALSVNTFVVDMTAPTLDNISTSTSDGRYFYGDNITFSVSFNVTVYVDNSSGNPRIQMETGTDDSYAKYVSGNSTSVLSFVYTVQRTDNSSDLDYKATNSLSTNNGTIRDLAGNDATLTLPSPGASGSVAQNKNFIIGGWKQQAYIKAANNDASDQFGMSVELFNDTLAVGVYGEDSIQNTITNGTSASSNNSNLSSGAVYVYKRTGSSWVQEAYIKAANNDEESHDMFGTSVSLSGDTLAVGAEREDSNQTTITNGTSANSDNQQTSSGAVYVYKRTGTSWAQEAYIKAANNDMHDYFGKASIALSGDTLAVGSDSEDSNQTTITNGTTASNDDSASDSGAVYVYRRSGTTWAQEAYIKSVNNEAIDQFGTHVTLDNDTLVVGALYEDSNQSTITNGTTASDDNSNQGSGAVYVYRRSGTTWVQEAYIKPANNYSNFFAYFGFNVDLSGDTLAVGAYNEDSNQTTITNGTTASNDESSSNSGAVYVYKRTGTSWAQEAYIKAVNNNDSDFFGRSIAMGNDTLVVGAHGEDSNQNTITNGTSASSNNSNLSSGAVYVYKRTGSSWAQEAYIKASNNDDQDYFGWSVSFNDNDTLVVGARQESSNQNTITNGDNSSSNNSISSSGAVYVYSFTGE